MSGNTHWSQIQHAGLRKDTHGSSPPSESRHLSPLWLDIQWYSTLCAPWGYLLHLSSIRMSKCVRIIKSSGSVFTRRRMTLVTRHNLPCSISGRLGPRSGRRTWSGSTNTDSHNRLQIWSCGRCRRSVHHPGEQPSPPTPWLAGSPSPCSWTTAAGCLWMKQKYDSVEGWPYFQERRQKVTEGQQWVQLILPSCHRVFLCLLLFPDQLTDSKNSSNRYEKRERKSIGFIEGGTVLDFYTQPNNPETNGEGSWFMTHTPNITANIFLNHKIRK